MPTANTAQKSNAGLSLRAEQFNHLKSANKCFAFSLSLSGTASALGTLGVMHKIRFINMKSMIKIKNPATLASIEIALFSWFDLLANEDYLGAFNFTVHDLYYEWTPKLMEEVINGYGLPYEEDGSEKYKVTDWRTAKKTAENQGEEIILYDQTQVDETQDIAVIGEIWYDLPLNGEWSDLTVTFRILRFQDFTTLELNEIHVM